jgi:hypothetical protein
LGDEYPAWALREHREDITRRKDHELEDALFELFQDAEELANKLKGACINTDSLVGRMHWVRTPGWRGWLLQQGGNVHDFEHAWNLHGCPEAGMASLVLHEDGQLFAAETPMHGGDDQIPVMPKGAPLEWDHIAHISTVHAVRERLDRLAAANL